MKGLYKLFCRPHTAEVLLQRTEVTAFRWGVGRKLPFVASIINIPLTLNDHEYANNCFTGRQALCH